MSATDPTPVPTPVYLDLASCTAAPRSSSSAALIFPPLICARAWTWRCSSRLYGIWA